MNSLLFGGATARKRYADGRNNYGYDRAYGPSMPVTGSGLALHAALSNPLAAYGLPAAGVGLAAWGVHDLLMAQQQAEKDKQLPLQGGVN